ncbi:MAG: hypothetical protein Nk1A_8230 [Endomicrobiia bacterium]|nr:MAG: hypothetical protein Nk1A_8230 [Endomicrobiia bacterium]
MRRREISRTELIERNTPDESLVEVEIDDFLPVSEYVYS